MGLWNERDGTGRGGLGYKGQGGFCLVGDGMRGR